MDTETSPLEADSKTTLRRNVRVLTAVSILFGLSYGGFLTAISPLVAEFLGIRAHGALFGIADRM